MTKKSFISELCINRATKNEYLGQVNLMGKPVNYEFQPYQTGFILILVDLTVVVLYCGFSSSVELLIYFVYDTHIFYTFCMFQFESHKYVSDQLWLF